MGDVRIESIDMEKDLGVHIHKSLKVKEQVNYVVKKVNIILGTIRRTYTDKSMIKQQKLIHHHRKLPTGMVPTSSEIYRRLERVQRRAVKMITGISKLPYYIRL